jgi:hypothetical protein
MNRRLVYWDYLRKATQFLALQNRILTQQIEDRDRQVQAASDLYLQEKEKI